MTSTTSEQRLLELLDRIERTVSEIRTELGQGRPDQERAAKAVEAFADEAFRARDA